MSSNYYNDTTSSSSYWVTSSGDFNSEYIYTTEKTIIRKSLPGFPDLPGFPWYKEYKQHLPDELFEI